MGPSAGYDYEKTFAGTRMRARLDANDAAISRAIRLVGYVVSLYNSLRRRYALHGNYYRRCVDSASTDAAGYVAAKYLRGRGPLRLVAQVKVGIERGRRV